MAVLEGIRKKTGLLLIFVAGALVLFLVQGFAQEILSFAGSDENIYKGNINGERIKNEDFQRAVNQSLSLEKFKAQRSGQEFPEYMEQAITTQTWNDLVYKHALKPMYESAGIYLTEDITETKGDPEIVDMMQGTSVDEQVVSQFSSEGDPFNVNKVKKIWQDVSKIEDARQREEQTYILNDYVTKLGIFRHQAKFESLFSKSQYVTTMEAKRQHYADNSTLDFDFVYVPFSSLPDSAIKMSDADLQEHLNNNKNKFTFKNGRAVEFVTFEATPSKEDTAKAFKAAAIAADGFRKTTNDTAFYTRNSDRPSQPNAFSVEQLPSQLKEDIAYLTVGYVKGPIAEYDSYDVYKVIGKSNATFAQTAHILINFGEDSAASEKKALDVLAKAKSGQDFGVLAAQYSEDPGSKDNGGEYPVQEKNGSWVKEFEDAVFDAKKTGVIPNLVKTQFGYHIMKVLKTSYKEEKWVIVKISKDIKPSKQTKEMTFREASIFASGVDNIGDLKKKADTNKELEIEASPLFTKTSKSVGTLYNADEIVNWAYNPSTSIGDVKIFTIPNTNKYVIAGLKTISSKDKPTVEAARDEIELSLRNEIKAQTLKLKLEKLTEDLSKRADKLNEELGPNAAVYQDVKEHKFSNNYVQGAGNEPKMVGIAMALNAEKRQWSRTEVGNSGVFIVRTNKKVEANGEVADYSSEKKAIEAKKNRNPGTAIINAMKDKAKVIDNDN